MSEVLDVGMREKLPGNIDEFLDLNNESISKNEEIRRAQINELTDGEASEEDLFAAEALIEEGVVELSEEEVWESAEKGLITFRPPQTDKGPMIFLSTENIEIYDLFNMAAGRALKDFGGFHQIGSSNRSGVSGWEIWDPKNKKSHEFVKMVFDQSVEIARIR